VFLIGAQATGKTELFEALRAEYPGSPAVEEVARKVMKEKGWTGADTGREGRQRVLFERSVEAETEAARGEGVEVRRVGLIRAGLD
jgi:predicted ATPase